MTEPLPSQLPSQFPPPPSFNAPLVAKNLQQSVDEFTGQLEKLTEDGSLSADPHFQAQVENTVRQVSRIVEEIQRSINR